MKTKLANELIDFIDNSPSVFHVIESAKNLLLEKGFIELEETKKWSIEKGHKYFISKSSALVAFTMGTGNIEEHGFKIISAHTDSPAFKIKPNSEILTEGCMVSLNVETYGGAILSTWFDRPLTIAGKVIVKGECITKPIEKLVHIKRPIMIIPNIAIHLNRDVNNSYKYNKQKDTIPLLGFVNEQLDKNDYLLNLLASELKVEKNDILDYELYLEVLEKGSIIGLNNELWMVFAGIKSLTESNENKSTKMMVCFDTEEVGSITSEGADSNMLVNLIARINECSGNTTEQLHMGLANSFMISADLGHAVHPNHTEKHDPTNRPTLGGGVVIKYSANRKYATNSLTASIVKQCCDKANVPYQIFVNRSDALGGSTNGPVSNSKLTIPVADVGTCILSMHSCRELGAVEDNVYVLEAFKTFLEV
jgi:aspartyl aminopeptidase